ncbi:MULTISPECIES: 2OG-Fe(II) oxygenase [Mesonia]|uniref:PKHD-type hydroxylase YbiX n=1 Tax=Mesonia oceanica TaxID=2687242 RepID=A0AC61Y3G0_9FLAO|nr:MULTISPECIES: 2OG-Fe(II) oxygenase [Mesonia]MAN28286.1 oxidoreductase [Mesonia sp.]MAQ41457.1 oxidoreductase [Mesonia sp.]VVU98994.1 PKHD-type hydroxylase YbiX [Mesonia oceanica]|tara:strand:- start:3318 stop:3962 length:645 start_codon:yes stop_codon:yes gene_type:complete
MDILFEEIDFQVNDQYEQIIEDLQKKKYSVVDDFFSAEEIEIIRNGLLTKYEEDQFKKSAIGNRVNELIESEIRGDFILWLNEAEAGLPEKTYFNKINQLVDYLNRTCFMGILHKEFHYAVYPKGTFYKRHLDTFQNDGRRKLSVVCYLNDESWKKENGGELTIYTEENGTEKPIDLFPFPGRVVIFESQELEHEVQQVKNDKRLSITGWLKTR